MKLTSAKALILGVLFVGAGAIFTDLQATVAAAAAQSANASDSLAGSWKMSFTDAHGNARQATLVLQQDGEKLTGNFEGARGTFPLSGTVRGSEVSITVKAMGRQVTFSGTADGTQMKGTTDNGKAWSASRQ